MKYKKKLSELETKVLNAFVTPDTDIDIVAIYLRVYGQSNRHILTPVRSMQMKLAPAINRINNKISGAAIVVGEAKRTYRLDTKGA